jgi:hypothetical protein
MKNTKNTKKIFSKENIILLFGGLFTLCLVYITSLAFPHFIFLFISWLIGYTITYIVLILVKE